MKNSIETLVDYIKPLRFGSTKHRRKRIRTIFNYIRRTSFYSDWSDIVLVYSIVKALDFLKQPYSKNEIYIIFKELDKTKDYEKEDRYFLMKELLENAVDGSVFTEKDGSTDQ